MTKPPNPDKQSQLSSNSHQWQLLASRTGIALGVPLLVGLAGGTWWLWNFVHNDLAPLVQKTLIQIVNRPVQMGRLESFSLTGLRFGATSVPATPTDRDRASVRAVDVAFNPLEVLFTRSLNLDVTLVQPDVFIDQDKQGNWISTTLAQLKPGLINIALNTVRVKNADVVLLPYPKTGNRKKPFIIPQVNGSGQLLQNQSLISFQLDGQPVTGGSFKIEGEARPKSNEANLQLQGQNLLGSAINGLVKLPLDLKAGYIDGNLAVQFRPKQKQPALFGTGSLKSVTAKFDQLPQPFINSQGILRFKGTQVGLENVSTSFGKIPLVANGVLDTQGQFNLTARVNSVSLPNVQETLNVKAPIAATGEFQADLAVKGSISKPILLGTFANIKPVRVDKVDFSAIRSQFEFPTATSAITFKNIQVVPAAGGQITGTGKIQLAQIPPNSPRSAQATLAPRVGFDLVAQNVPGDAIARVYGVSPQIKIGTVSAKTQVSGAVGNLQTVVNWQAPQATYPANGQINIILAGTNTLLLRNTVLNVAGGTVRAEGQLADGRWQASGNASGIQLERLAQVPPALRTPLNGTFNFSGSTASFNPETISLQGTGRLNIAGSTVTASNIQVARGRWQALLQATGVQLGRLAEVPPPLRTPLSGRVNLSGTTASFKPETLIANGSGSVNVAGGTVTASNIKVAQGQWQALGTVAGVQLGRLLPQLPPQMRGLLTSQFNLLGSLTAFKLETVRGTAQGSVNVAGGTVRATNVQLAGGQWQALGTAAGVQLGRLLPQLPPQFQGTLRDGRFNLSGSLAAITPEAVRGNASGSLRVAGGTVTASNLQLSDGRWQGSFAADQVQMAGLAQLGALSRFSPKVRGRVSANINASGSLTNFNVAAVQAAGQLRLLSLAVNGLDFDPVLSGEVSVAPEQGVNLQLAGVQDRIEVALSPTYRPVSFLIQRDEAIATGRTQGDLFLVSSEKFPISIFKTIVPLPAAIASQPVSGELSASLEINLNTFATEGNVAIARPAIGTIRADQFVAQFRYANGVGTLTEGELTQGETRYALSGGITQTRSGPQFQAQVNITQGQIQNILTALQLYDVQDFRRGLQPPTYGRAADVTTVPVGAPNATLLTQLRRFSEIEVVQRQEQERRDGSPIPSIAELTGTFNGQISASGSLQKGVTANFDFEGKNWELGSYTANQIIAQGSFENGVLTLLPLRIESEDTLLAFNGQVGGIQQSGQLRVSNFPVDVLKSFVKLPVDITGQLNATATLAGSQANPQAIGELSLDQGSLNQKPVESALATFSYNDARLNFGSRVVVSGPEPIQITGSVPYALPFAKVKPDSEQIRLDVNVQNEGLALLNLLTNQVAWQGGQGQVQLQARGTLKQPVATGIVTVNNATISAQALPEPLTDVTGTIQFNGNRIQVEGVQGKFSRGNVVAQGVIPIFGNLGPNDPDRANPLTVTLDQLALNLKGLYQGGASGNVVITGSALNPVVGGEVVLAQGQVSLTEAAGAVGTPGADATSFGGANKQVDLAVNNPVGGGAANDGVGGMVPEFNNLRLSLGRAIAITRPPVLNFQATGTLAINGTLNDLRPQGTIRLRRGDVNLFTTQFVLERGYEQTATFSPNQGLDPTLNVRLVAAVPEVTQTRVPSSTVSSEISEGLATDFGALQTVRVRALVQGPASQLFDNLELKSDPSRSQSEIIGLLGGSFVNTLGRGDSTLGFANLAGSALLGNFQGTFTNIGNALGLSELRLFPTVISDQARARSTSTLGLAAEAGVDISRNLSASVLSVLTAPDQPTQFGVNYRVNNQLRLRTSTDLSGDTRAVVEYENQF